MRQPSIEVACRKVLGRFGIEIRDAEGFSCCPDPVVTERLQREMWLALAARNLVIAEKAGKPLATVCNGCYETLFEAIDALETDAVQREKAATTLSRIGLAVPQRMDLRHIVEILFEDIGVENIEKLSSKRLRRLKVAVHPGCHLYRSHTRDKTQEKPKMLEQIVSATGAKPVDYGIMRFCCGYPHRVVEEEFSLKMMLARKLQRIWDAGADCVVVCCPACNIQFEFGQLELKRRYNIAFDSGIPIVHVVELVALSLGIKPEEFGLQTHRGPTSSIVSKLE
ncbi:CoB--CoM heterodisulfide reductase iron-sulfur subunit B family protein [Candidatus Bathyarchaeota archaeon]|nr:CoB--CoM heterodisulfide reductase iron-sulfur subunit B family protein [Candidatus Bathyarchaeota archaeon]